MATQGGGGQGRITRGRFTAEEMKVLSGLVHRSDFQLATLSRKATTLAIDAIHKGCRANGMNRSRHQIYAKVKSILGSDKGNARLQQPLQMKGRHAQRGVRESGQASQLQAVEQLAKEHADMLQASLKDIQQQGQATLEQMAAEQAATLQVAVEQILQQGHTAMEKVAAQQAAVESMIKQGQATMEKVAAQQAAIKEAALEALEQGQAVLDVASAKQAAMHAAVEHALEEGQSALELASARHESVHLVVETVLHQVAVQQAAIQAAVAQAQQVTVHEAQPGQADLLDLLPAVGAPGDEAALQVDPDDEMNLELEL